MICGYCTGELGFTDNCPSCAPVARLKAEYNGQCYAYMLLRCREKPDGYEEWLARRRNAS